MDKKCDPCEFLKNPDPRTQILDTDYWRVVLGDNHAYFGRAFVTLKEHKGDLGSLSQDEWSDLHDIIKKHQTAYKDAFGAEPLNWSCLMNGAFWAEPFNPHVHWHVFPRYKVAPVFDGVTYADPSFGKMYDFTIERMAHDETVERIAATLKQYVPQNP